MTDAPDLEPVRYVVQFSPLAAREGIEAAVYLSHEIGEENARLWYAQMRHFAGTLATNPGRNPVRVRESRYLGVPVRRLLYRRTPGSAAYHLLYRIQETLPSGEPLPDGPRVTIIHIRHASRRPITRAEGLTLRTRLTD